MEGSGGIDLVFRILVTVASWVEMDYKLLVLERCIYIATNDVSCAVAGAHFCGLVL